MIAYLNKTYIVIFVEKYILKYQNSIFSW